jgi:hypothetical protein
MALSTAISFFYSKRFAAIFEESAKKHKNMVVPIITLKTSSKIELILSIVF